MFFLVCHGEVGLELAGRICTGRVSFEDMPGLECEFRSFAWYLGASATVQSQIITCQIYGSTYIWQCRYMTQH